MTLRELQTLELISQGKQYAAIASELNISYKTVANTCSQIKTKLGVRSLPELMRIAIDYLPEISNRRPSDLIEPATRSGKTWQQKMP
jgi:DNA-binding CsgD family transcriptional regulator